MNDKQITSTALPITRRRVLAEHTYAHRARQVAELLDISLGREAAE